MISTKFLNGAQILQKICVQNTLGMKPTTSLIVLLFLAGKFHDGRVDGISESLSIDRPDKVRFEVFRFKELYACRKKFTWSVILRKHIAYQEKLENCITLPEHDLHDPLKSEGSESKPDHTHKFLLRLRGGGGEDTLPTEGELVVPVHYPRIQVTYFTKDFLEVFAPECSE